MRRRRPMTTTARRHTVWALAAFGTCLVACSTDAGDDDPETVDCNESPTLDCIYSPAPDIGGCAPGRLSSPWQQRTIDAVNAVRAQAGVAQISVADANLEAQASCALIGAASDIATLDPSADSPCFSTLGANACSRSNVFNYRYRLNTESIELVPTTLWSPETIVQNWMVDADEPTLGHRRLILDPFLGTTALGMAHKSVVENGKVNVTQSLALLTQPDEAAPELPETAPDFVAWPQNDVPIEWFPIGTQLSFSVVHDRRSSANNAGVSFDNATIRVTGPDGADIAVSDIRSDYNYFGVPNHLGWRTTELTPNTRYEVTITGVTVLATTRSYTFGFRLIE